MCWLIHQSNLSMLQTKVASSRPAWTIQQEPFRKPWKGSYLPEPISTMELHLKNFYFFLPIFILCALVFCLRVCLCEGVRSWSYRQGWAVVWVLGIEPGSSRRATFVLTTEPSLQPQFLLRKCWTSFYTSLCVCVCTACVEMSVGSTREFQISEELELQVCHLM